MITANVPVVMTADDVLAILAVLRDADIDQGYEPADHDRHDMAQLRRVFRIATHFS